jgi:TatD DNase family protein
VGKCIADIVADTTRVPSRYSPIRVLGMQVFDTHCHLGLDGKVSPQEEHARAVAAGVTDFCVVGIDAGTSAAAAELSALPGVRWSAGLHPNDATRFCDEWPAIERLARTPGCAAIGETGIDCFRDRTPLDRQIESLHRHVELARELGLAVIFHCRDAFAPLFEQLARYGTVRGVMHCFSGGVDEARRSLDLGLDLSFAGPLTYPKNDELRRAAAFAPLERIHVETDAPFLPPQPYRGKRNEPAYVVLTLQTLAECRGIDLRTAAAATHANGLRLFTPTPAR